MNPTALRIFAVLRDCAGTTSQASSVNGSTGPGSPTSSGNRRATKPGNPATAKVWAWPGTSFSGEVTAVAPAAEAAPYGKVVRVQMSLQDPDGRPKPEMTGSAKAAGDRHMAIVVYTRALMRFIWIEVWSWLP